MLRTVAHVPPKGSYRTVVVGAGPAGVMAAMRASAAGPVLLVDAAPLPRHKSCGGMIHALAIRVLARHGISINRAV
ncbi:MAG: NAD(P)/FAD-dependent oxidoreductase, partial [Coriobacteriia bacterium]|nr:NAD(P)/FAD-dependent oxidoreductase [Coriobacteriia bacterium]